MTVLEISGLEKNFGRKRVLRGLSFNMGESEIFSLIGPNASGKTTLLKIVATILKPTSGSVEIFGKDVEEDSSEVRRLVGFVGHETYLYPGLTARENLIYYAKSFGVKDKDFVVERKLKEVGMYHRMNDKIEKYSRGMKQRVSIARSLIHEPELLILDEPNAGLDLKAQRKFLNRVRDFAGNGGSVIMSSHDSRVAWNSSDKVGVLHEGKVRHIFETSRERYKDLGIILDNIKWEV